jgi:hypothetical protein
MFLSWEGTYAVSLRVLLQSYNPLAKVECEASMKVVLFLVSGIIVAVGLMVWRFRLCQHRYPSTDVLIDAIMRLESSEERTRRASCES